MKDHKNPDFIFSMTDSELLLKAAKGEIDINMLVRKQLACRGLGKNGEWVGFGNATKVWSK